MSQIEHLETPVTIAPMTEASPLPRGWWRLVDMRMGIIPLPLRIGPTIGRATKAPIAALAPSTTSTTRLGECATMSTARGEPSISPGVEKKLLYAATAVRAPVPRPRLLRDVSLMCPTYRGLDLSLRCVSIHWPASLRAAIRCTARSRGQSAGL
jgi:hypothetical protein